MDLPKSEGSPTDPNRPAGPSPVLAARLEPGRTTFSGLLRTFPEFFVAAALFIALTGLSWRRWASFEGDINREWTTPARIAAGESLYRDVAYYYGPLVPWVEGGLFRVSGSRTGTAIGFGLLLATSLIGVVLTTSRPFLSPIARVATATVITGVFAFAPNNGALIAPYSLSAVAAMALAWSGLLAAFRQRPGLTGLLCGLALLAKVEAAPVFLLALLLLPLRSAVGAAGLGAVIAAGGYTWALAGLPFQDLVAFGPLRHLVMPAEFKELYSRISGLHPAMRGTALQGLVAGAALVSGWALVAAAGSVPRRRLAGGLLLLAGLGLWTARWPEPLLTTAVRGVPALTLGGFLAACASHRFSPRRFLRAPVQEKLPLVTCLAGLAFLWRTILWVVPSYPYAPLAAISAVPAAVLLLQRLGPLGPLPWLPLFLAPVFLLPRLVDFYRGPRVEVRTPRALWYLPPESGEIQAEVISYLASMGVRDRSLLVIPEASAINFVLGVRSPVRLEQWLPGLLDETADKVTRAELERTRPERVVWLDRKTPEFGGQRFGREYGQRCAAFLGKNYVIEKRFHLQNSNAIVLRRNDLQAQGGVSGSPPSSPGR